MQECAKILYAWLLSVPGRTKTDPSMNCFQYHRCVPMCYTRSDIHPGLGLGMSTTNCMWLLCTDDVARRGLLRGKNLIRLRNEMTRGETGLMSGCYVRRFCFRTDNRLVFPKNLLYWRIRAHSSFCISHAFLKCINFLVLFHYTSGWL